MSPGPLVTAMRLCGKESADEVSRAFDQDRWIRGARASIDYLVMGDAWSAPLGQAPKLGAQRKAEALDAKGASIAIVREEAFYDMKKR